MEYLIIDIMLKLVRSFLTYQIRINLILNNSKIPAMVKTKNNKISKNFFSTGIEPPIKASGTEPTK